MSIYEFLSRLEADPFDPDIIKLFDEEAAQHAAEAKEAPTESPPQPTDI